MKHIFIVNPASGRENSTDFIKQKIREKCTDQNCEMYVTQYPGDATDYIRDYCSTHKNPVRFYACGGDGTLNEVANGAAEFEFASIGCVPCGSGNDFIKYYGNKQNFLDLERQISGKEVPIDLIRVGKHYAINAVHFGFDSCVADLIPKLRRKKLIGGKLAYPTAVAMSLFNGTRHVCRVEVDGELLNEKEELLLCTIANGQYVGGSYRCAPRSKNDDGELEVCVMQPISIFKFVSFSNVYKEGNHLDDERFKPFMRYKKGKSIHVQAPVGFFYSLDGEIVHENDFTAEVIPSATRFIVP